MIRCVSFVSCRVLLVGRCRRLMSFVVWGVLCAVGYELFVVCDVLCVGCGRLVCDAWFACVVVWCVCLMRVV